jgi:hypothetical protein
MKHSWILALQFLFFGFAPQVTFAQALEETTALLTNPEARGKLIQNDAGAKRADEQVKALGLGAAGEAKIYELSAKIFEKMNLDGGGDSEKLNSSVQNLLRDPASLEKEITAEQRAQIHDLSLGVHAAPTSQ